MYISKIANFKMHDLFKTLGFCVDFNLNHLAILLTGPNILAAKTIKKRNVPNIFKTYILILSIYLTFT